VYAACPPLRRRAISFSCFDNWPILGRPRRQVKCLFSLTARVLYHATSASFAVAYPYSFMEAQ
jgi:hypothetical protein